MPKKILYGTEARAALIRGVDFLANAVKVTLGPKGRIVVMSRRNIGQSPQCTKDGVTVSNHCDPVCPFEQLGSDLAREAAQKTVEHAGDGTTTSVVLAQAMAHAGMKELEKGASPAELERSIRASVEAITQALDKMALPADGKRLSQVATISANSDEEIGRLVHQAIERVGKDGVMYCEESRSFDTTLDIVDGMQLKQGFRSPHFINAPERLECVFENALILMWEGKIDSPKSLVNVLKLAAGLGKPLLVIAGDYDPLALAMLAGNNNKNGLRLCAIRADAWGPRRREILEDIAIITGGAALTEDLGSKLENVTVEQLGRARRIVVNEYRTTIMEGEGTKAAVEIRAELIRERIEASTETPDVQALLRQRLAGLTGGIAVIRVGGATESEMRERKDRVEDALYATKAAAEEGIVVGAGLALTFACKELEANHFLKEVCKSPLRQIVANAGLELPIIFTLDCFLNSATGEREDLLKSGVIDPVKVVKEALKNAASVAITILKTETLIVDAPEKAE